MKSQENHHDSDKQKMLVQYRATCKNEFQKRCSQSANKITNIKHL